MKTKVTRRCKLAVTAVLFSGGLFHYASADAAGPLLDIAKVPLFVGSVGVPPNVFITLDDSGSMDWEFTTNRHWQANFYDWDIVGTTLNNTLGSSTAPTDTFPDSQKRWYSYGVNSIKTGYTGTVSSMFSYYYDSGDNIYLPTVCEGSGTNSSAIYNCNSAYTLWRPDKRTNPATPQTGILWDWRVFSSDLNTLYYDPGAAYKPWEGMTENASYTAARSNPKNNSPAAGTAGYTVIRDLSATDFYYAVWQDNKGFAGTRPGRGINAVSDSISTTDGHMISTSNGYVDLWDNYTLYTVKAGATDIMTVQEFQTETCKTVSPTPAHKTTANFSALNGASLDQNDPRCWYYCASSTTGTTTACTTPPSTYQYRYQKGRLVVSPVGSATTLTGAGSHPELGGKTIAEVKQNIANWYQYYRKRSFVAKGALAKVITAFPKFRYGISVLNQWSGSWPNNLFIQMPTEAQPPYDTHNADLLQKMYGFRWTASGTPLQAALDRAGRYFSNDLAPTRPTPILSAEAGGQCQQNFSLLTTDGFWNGTLPSGIGDQDGDTRADTLADVAYKYYRNDLSPLDNKVLKTKEDLFKSTYMWQHMVTFTVGFGVEGLLPYPTGSGWPAAVEPLDTTLLNYGDAPNATEKNLAWGNPNVSANTPAKIDDMWHAAYNGRGAFISAKNPDQLVTGLSEALSMVEARSGSAAALSLNAGFVTDSKSAATYQAGFNSADWTGVLKSVTLESDGTFGAVLWDTGPGSPFATQEPGTRKIFTRSGGVGVEFLWDNLDTGQKAALNTHPLLGLDGKGPQRLDFLRGKGVATADVSWLAANNFRKRASMLGDIVHSDPFFADGSPPVVYVGANDGMLHAFHADTGAELFAYIPGAIFKRLSALPEKDYAHNYTVDGSAVVQTIGARKILVGTLRGGGQSLFALDVTDPTHFNASKVLWEYSDNDLGYTFGKPTIAKLANGKWAVFIGNGYNNTEGDGSQSATGNAALYVLILKDDLGIDTVAKLDTGKGVASAADGKPNGLASPAVIFDLSHPETVQAAYAGDLQGNLWKFDLSGGAPTIAYCASTPCQPLFTAKNADNQVQPITVRPEVDLHPLRGFLVYFGTGKYFETGDNSSAGQPTQTLYAIWDRAWGEVDGDPAPGGLLPQTRAHLLQQDIIDNPGGFYVTTNREITWHPDIGANPSGASHVGWYVDLIVNGDNHGEKQVTSGRLRNKKVIFNTTIPSTSLCDAGGTGNQIILDAVSGSRLTSSPFKDQPPVKVTIDGVEVEVPVSGRPTPDILSEPQLIENLQTERDHVVSMGSSGQPDSVEIDVSQQAVGRQFWRQLQQQ